MGRRPRVPDALKTGPFTLADARRHGLDRWHLEGASWQRLARGAYAWVGLEDTPMRRPLAARQRLPTSAVFSGLTAAWLHGIDVQPCDPIEVTVPALAAASTRKEVRLRQATLEEGDVTVVRGMRTTTMARTIADLCLQLSLTEAVVVADAALHERRVTIAKLTSWADAHAGRAGIAKLRRALRYVEAASESAMETRLRMLLRLAGLPPPKAQVWVVDRRIDLYYEEARLGVEYDGATHRSSIAEDSRRHNELLQSGVRILRFTAGDIYNRPDSVVAHVTAALRAKDFPR